MEPSKRLLAKMDHLSAERRARKPFEGAHSSLNGSLERNFWRDDIKHHLQWLLFEEHSDRYGRIVCGRTKRSARADQRCIDP